MKDERIFVGPDHIDDSEAPWTDTMRKDFHVAVFYDKYPCTPGHLLFVPQYNTVSVLKEAFEDAFAHGKNMVDTGEWDGFNIGLNYGAAAGQTVNWPHIHLIPRRNGDVADPVGGVRNTIPGMGNYKKKLTAHTVVEGDSEGGDLD
jgi:diadenosine tetraphosphate (Ap4A) HIT family hydrolase